MWINIALISDIGYVKKGERCADYQGETFSVYDEVLVMCIFGNVAYKPNMYRL